MWWLIEPVCVSVCIREAAPLQRGAAAAVGEVGSGDPRPAESGAGVARHVRHGGGRRHRLRRGGAPVQGHQGQAQLPGARPGPLRPRLPRHPRHPGPPPVAGPGGDAGGNAAAAALPAADRRAVPGPHAVRAAAAGRPGWGGGAPAAAARAVHDDGHGRRRRHQPAVRRLRCVALVVGAADPRLLDTAAHPTRRPAVVARCGNVLVRRRWWRAVDAVVRDHRVIAQRQCMAVRRGEQE
jgi:hypothetical protein